MRIFSLHRLLIAVAFTLCAAGSALAQTTTVILVRHAEKMDDSADPVLSDAGAKRAESLAAALADAGVTSVVTTQYQRTVLTAAPLAEQTGIAPIVIAATGANHAEVVAVSIREIADGRVILVVGHSNTVPSIIRALGGPDVGHIADDDYGNLYVLTLADEGARLVRSRY